jgi:type I restriction enzyme S subunit
MHLLKHFKELTIRPNNAHELKGLILKLAIQGKLTDNWRSENPEIESASKLLEQLKVEKEKLIKEKKIRKEKPLLNIKKDDLINNLPNKWITVRLGEIGDWGAGSTPLRSNSLFYDGEINWFKSGELNNGIIDYESNEKITEFAIKKSSLRLNNPGDVLIAMYGATIGKTGILNISGTTNQAVCACTPFSCIGSSYLHLLLKALKDTFINQGEGGAQPNISRVKIRNQVFGLPPREEQKAIVEVVETLFKEVEQLEQLTLERITLKEDFVTSALNQLTKNNAKQEWAFLQEHFHSFFNETSNIKKLRETVLQLAVQGKLTADWRANNPNVEDASILLKRIQKEKEQLINDKKIKKEKPLPAITKDDIPYVLTEGWVWCRFQDLILNIEAGKSPKCDPENSNDNEWGVIKMSAISWGVFNANENKALPLDVEVFEDKEIKPGDFILTRANTSELIAKSVIVQANVRSKLLLNDKTLRIRCFDSISDEYLNLYNNGSQAREHYKKVSSGTSDSMQNISRENIKLLIIPLPPLEEQKAIVLKVNALMGLCDALEHQVKQSQEHSEQLMQSVLREVFGPDNLN